jgi:superfamily II DNA or RNA helicase
VTCASTINDSTTPRNRITIRVHAELTVTGLPRAAEQVLIDKNTFDDPAFERKERLGLWTGDTDRSITLYRHTPAGLVLPRGTLPLVIKLCRDRGIAFRVQNDTIAPQLGFDVFAGTLRPYQERGLSNLLRWPTGLLEAPTGSGKTNVALSVIPRLGTRTLILTHTTELLNQTRERCRQWLGVDPGLIGAGKWDIQPITVAMVQTLSRRPLDEIAASFGCILVDECFPAGTLVDGRPIERIAAGDSVTAFCPATGNVVVRRVVRTMRQPASSLLRIWVSGESLVCTPSHKVWTEAGWRKASDLRPGHDRVLRVGERHAEPHSDNVRALRMPSDVNRETSDRHVARQWADVLRRRVQGDCGERGTFRSDGPHEPNPCLRTHDSQESDDAIGRAREGQRDAKGHAPRAEDSRRQWATAPLATTRAQPGVGLADRGCGENESRTPERHLPERLQDRHREHGAQNCDRSGRGLTRERRAAGTRPTQGGASTWARVDRVEVLEPGRDGRFGGLCPDGYVYNLEVEDVHTYTANGCVVSNCHHAPARTWAAILNQLPARYKYGFTATAWRKDGLQCLMWRTIGSVTAKIDPAEVTRAGSTIEPEVETVDTTFYYDLQDSTDWGQMITALILDDTRNALIAGEVRKRMSSETRALVLSDRIEHVYQLADRLDQYKPVVLTGDLSKGARDAAMLSVRAGAQLTIATSSLLGEGVDVPGWDLLFLATPMAGGPRTLQAVGRVTRAAPGKDRATVVDFVDVDVPALVAAYRQRERLYTRPLHPTDPILPSVGGQP